MKLPSFINRSLVVYLVKFFAIFAIAYYGTIAVEGLASPENYYSPFVQKYLDYPSWLRASLLNGTKFMVSLFGHESIITDPYHIKFVNGKSVQLIYACLGIGVTSFWLAFVVANRGGWLKKLLWVLGGALGVWIINVSRISMVLTYANKDKEFPLGLDNHTFFDILAYVAIFLLMFLYDRSFKKEDKV